MLARCPHCDKPYIVAGDEAAPCPHCGQAPADAPAAAASEAKAVVAEGGSAGPEAPHGRAGVSPAPARFLAGRPAWEQPERPLLTRFFGTFADAALRPTAFYTNLSREGQSGVTVFAYVCLLVGTVGQAAWALASLPLLRALGERAGGGLDEAGREAAKAEGGLLAGLISAVEMSEQSLERLALVETQLWATLVLAPLMAFFTIHLLAGIVHFSVQPFRHPEQEPVAYEVTYRFLAYAHAPMLLAALPTVGSLASLFSFALILIAIRRLHRVRMLGLIGGVVFPALFLSWLWGQEVLPRIAPPLTAALGLGAADEPDEVAEGESAYKPMPPADRDHSIELHERSGWLYSERYWEASFGRLRVRHLVAAEPRESGGHLGSIEVEHKSGEPAPGFFVELEVPEGARLLEEPLEAFIEPGHAQAEVSLEDGVVHARFPVLEPGQRATVVFVAAGKDARALLQRGPAVGRAP